MAREKVRASHCCFGRSGGRHRIRNRAPFQLMSAKAPSSKRGTDASLLARDARDDKGSLGIWGGSQADGGVAEQSEPG